MAKKRRKRRNPRIASVKSNPKRRRRARRNPVLFTRRIKRRRTRRNPGFLSGISGQANNAKALIPNAAAVIVGTVGSRYAVKQLLPAVTGYARGAAMAVAGVILGMGAKMAMKGAKGEHLGNMVTVGGLCAGALDILDMITGGSIRDYVNLSDSPEKVYYMPRGYRGRALADYPAAGMIGGGLGDYAPAGQVGAVSNSNWTRAW